MRYLHAFFVAAFAVTVLLSLFIAPASAKFIHPRGVMMTIYPQDESEYMVFISPGVYTRRIAVAIVPPWYFVPGLMGFDTVTATLTLDPNCYQCKQFTPGTPPVLGTLNATDPWTVVDSYQSDGQWVSARGAQLTNQWSNVQMTEENNGAVLTFTFTITITTGTAAGFYMMYMNGEADAPGATFTGFDQWGVAYNVI